MPRKPDYFKGCAEAAQTCSEKVQKAMVDYLGKPDPLTACALYDAAEAMWSAALKVFSKERIGNGLWCGWRPEKPHPKG